MKMKRVVSLEARKKMSEKALNRDNTKRIESLPSKEKHWNWNNSPSKLALHKRLHRIYGKARLKKCNFCKKQALDWANITGKYTDDIKDYISLCRSCHNKLDYTEERREKTRLLMVERHKNKILEN